MPGPNEEFDLQPISGAVKGKFDLQPAPKDYGPEMPSEFTGPEDTRSGARKFLDAHPIVERLLTGTNPDFEAQKKLHGITDVQGPGIGTIPGFNQIRDIASHLADPEKIQAAKEGNTSYSPESNWWRGALSSFLPNNVLSPLNLLEGGFDPRTAGIKTGIVPQSTVALGQDLAKLKIPAADATVEGTLKPLLEANRAKTTVFPEPKVGEPPYNTSQFGLAPSSEALPYPLNVTPNRLRPPSTNATVFNALVPERYKTNAQGAFLPPTEEIVKPIQVERKLPSPSTVKSEYGRLISSQDNEALTGAEAKLKDFKARMGDETGAMFVGKYKQPPFGEPGSPERRKYMIWEKEQIIADKESKLANLKSKSPNEINWSKDWEADTRVNSISKAEDEINYFKDRLAKLLESEEGALRLKGKSASQTDDIRSSIIKAVSSGGKLNIAEMYKPFSSDVTPKQFSKIVDDILESGDLQRAYEGTRAANQSRLTAPMQSKPTSLADAISNLKNAVNQHITARATQDAMVTEEKARRFGKLAQIEGQGVEGFSKKSQALKGEYPKVPIEPVKEAISQIDLDELMNAPEKVFSDQAQRYRAQFAIGKVFGITGDRTPLQPNEIKLLQQTFGNEMADQLAQLHGGIALVADANPEFHKISELANLSKSIQSSTDFSAPLRQGLPMLLRSEFYPNFVKMFKYAGSEDSYKNLQSYLSNEWPERELARKSGLSISQIGTDIGPKEEHFLSGAPEKVPVLGKIYRGSERAYVGFIDKMRSDVFTSMINDLRKAGIQTETKISLKNGKEILVPTAESKAVARYVNVATGRGSLSMTLPESLGGKTISAEKYGDLLNSVFYSPRFQASRIQLVTDPLFQWNTLPKTVRKEYLKSLLAVGGFVTTANGLGYALGGKLTANPTSSDFGKIVSGPRNMTRTDPGGGWLQYLTLAAQLALNEKTNPVTGDTRVLGEGYKPTTRGDVVEQFGRYKLAPIPQYLWSAFTGKNAIGQDFDASSEAAKLVVPLVAQDIYDILKEDPSLASLGNSIPAIFGVGLNTFEEYKKKPKDESVKKTNILDSLTR